MREFLITITFFALAILFGCSCDSSTEKTKARPVTAELTWKNFDGKKLNDPMEASYVFNGIDLGKGNKGFDRVIDEVKKMLPGSEIHAYPFLDYFRPLSASGPIDLHIDDVPFLRMPYQYQYLRMIARKHKIDVWFYAAKPGETLRDGVDVRQKVDLKKKPFSIGAPSGLNRLTWQNYDGYKKTDPEEAVYYFNSVNCGKGSKGFARAIEEYKKDLRELVLIVYPDSYDQDVLDAIEKENGFEADFVDPVPFRGEPLQYHFLQEIVHENLVNVRYFASEYEKFSGK